MEIAWWKDRINISKDICMVQRLQPSEPYANIIIYREFQGFSAMHHAGCWLSLAVMVTLPGNEYWMTVPGTRCQYENGTVLMSVIICLNASI